MDKSKGYKIPANDSETEDDVMYGPDEAIGAEKAHQKGVRTAVQREEEEEEEEEMAEEEEVAMVEEGEEENDEEEEEEEEEGHGHHTRRHDADYEELEGGDFGPREYDVEEEGSNDDSEVCFFLLFNSILAFDQHLL